MQRRQFMKTGMIAAAGMAAPFRARAGESRPPNIIFILADDLGYADLGCQGQTRFKTPNLDRMAAEGMRFTQHYAGGTVCAPSRCSLMTGLHTGRAYIRGNKEIQPEGQHPIPADTFTLPKMMKRAGYATGAMGKWGLGGPGSEGEPNRQGFDRWYGYLCQREAHRFFPTHLWSDTGKVVLEENRDNRRQTYSQDLIVEESLQFIRDHKDGPFFLYLPFTIPHAELALPAADLEPFLGKFDEEPFGGRGNYGPQDHPRAAYAAMVARLDRDVGRVLSLLAELGLDENTLVMFSSDNGPHREGGNDPDFFDSNGPLRGIKRDLYEGGIRVPLVARWPGTIAPGRTSAHISAFWDMMPTCAELAGIEAPEGIDGISFAPSLTGALDAQREHEYLYWEFGQSKQAVRMHQWKAVRLSPSGPLELYNLERDLGETNNIADRHPGIADRMKAIMEEAHTESELFPLRS